MEIRSKSSPVPVGSGGIRMSPEAVDDAPRCASGFAMIEVMNLDRFDLRP